MSSKSDTPFHSRLWRGIVRRLGREGNGAATVEPPPEPPPPPQGFDWRWYVRSYTDLAPAGITDEESAISHWRHFGRREGRRFAPRRPNSFDWLSYVDRFEEAECAIPVETQSRPPFACPTIDSIFLRAWGDVVCWDDAGSDHVLQSWDPAVDYARVFLEGPYQRVRELHEEGEMPWPNLCSRCLLLRLRPVDRGGPWTPRFVRMLRIEPSYHCSLDCPGCVPLEVRRQHSKTFQLDPAILDRIIEDLLKGGLEIDALDFQGHGEPLLNPRVWEMAKRSRERLPECWISMTTNAHAKFRDEMTTVGFDEIVCSIDGIDAATYAPYRVHGDFDLAWKFMCDLVQGSRSSAQKMRVVWKYVVFEHNSSRQTLLRAQEMAVESGVSELVFVITRNGPTNAAIRVPSDIPRIETAPPISFRFHEPSSDDLEARADAARRLVAMGDVAGGELMARSILENLERFSSGGVETERAARLRKLLD